MKNQTLLSKKARYDLWTKRHLFIFDYGLFLGVGGMLFFLTLLISALYWESGETLGALAWIMPGSIGLTLGIILFIRKFLKIKRKALKENEKDYCLSLKVGEVTRFLRENPPGTKELRQMNFPGLQEMEKLKPVRIEYYPQEKLDGEFSGEFRGGWWLFSLGGVISGTIRGETTPNLSDQNMLLICSTENGDSIRLICPSIYLLRKNLVSHFMKLAEGYGAGGYTHQALCDLWQGQGGLKEILKKSNPQGIYDYLVTKLELPLKQRPSILVKGTPIREGALLVFMISCDNKKPEVIIPIGVISKIREMLEERLKRTIPIGPLTTELELVK